MLGMPTAEAAHSGKWHIAGCQPDMPIHRTCGCRNCCIRRIRTFAIATRRKE